MAQRSTVKNSNLVSTTIPIRIRIIERTDRCQFWRRPCSSVSAAWKPSPRLRAISRRHVSGLCKLWPRKRNPPYTLVTVVHGFQLLSEATGYSRGECLQNKYARLIKRQRRGTVVTLPGWSNTAAEQGGNTPLLGPSEGPSVVNVTTTIARGTNRDQPLEQTHAARFTATTYSPFARWIDIFPSRRKTLVAVNGYCRQAVYYRRLARLDLFRIAYGMYQCCASWLCMWENMYRKKYIC